MKDSPEALSTWRIGEVRSLRLSEIGEHYGRYRLRDENSARIMKRSLKRYGQISPLILCSRAGRFELVDGFKRLGAAREIRGMQTLKARYLELDDQHAKAAIYGLNRIAGKVCELEEAWLVHALVREDGLQQQEVAELLGRHKSWVCRRLALLERLCPRSREDLRLGLLSCTSARQLTRLPAGNQKAVLETMQRESLCAQELRQVVDLLLGCGERKQQAFVLADPRKAIAQDQYRSRQGRDPRLTHAANTFLGDLHMALDRLCRLRNGLMHSGLAAFSAGDRQVLLPHLERFVRECREVAQQAADFLQVLHEGASNENK